MGLSRLKNALFCTGLVCGTIAMGAVGTCAIEAKLFNSFAAEIPCKTLQLPRKAGKEPLTDNICVAVSGEQPQKIGVEEKDLGKGKKAYTLFLEWDFDGITEELKNKKPDAEPITLITEDGKPLEVQVCSHRRIGVHDFNECKHPSGKVVVAITNAFHTPVVAGCDPVVIDPQENGGINTSVFKIVYNYARAAGRWNLDSFVPLREADRNEVPDPDHPCRAQPLFVY